MSNYHRTALTCCRYRAAIVRARIISPRNFPSRNRPDSNLAISCPYIYLRY